MACEFESGLGVGLLLWSTFISLLGHLFLRLLCMALGKYLIQILPSMYALQCLTGKVDKSIVDMYVYTTLIYYASQ